MKKYRYIGQMLILISLFVYTQTLSAQMPIKYGLKFGGNFAGFTGSDAKGTQSKFTGAFGAFANYSVNDRIAIQPELLYIRKGSRTVLGANSTFVDRLDYVEIPVLVKGMITYDEQVFYGIIGPALDFKIHHEFTVSGGKNNLLASPTEKPNKTDFGAMVGIGTATADQRLSFEARYNFGLTKVYKSSNAKNGVVSLLMGITLN